MAATLAVLAAAVGLFLFATYKARQPHELGKLRWIPYGGIQFVAILIIVLALAHVISLLTGQPLVGRFSR
ncbi:MAG: hypothetical protein GKS00_26375 [Alphaproteobacteria bacterium]|nr:hypothetical protein [Alphaproteobacteria bacterium]